MADRFTIELQGDLLPAIDRAINQLERPRQLMDDIGGVLESAIATRFVTKQDPNGAPWAPLSKATLARKAGVGSTLIHRGHMLDSLAHNVGDDWTEVGFSSVKAAYHETGTKKNDKPHVPRRGMLTGDPESGRLGADDHAAVVAEITAWLNGVFD